MLRKGLMIVGVSLMASGCIGEDKQADNWPRYGDIIYAAEMHVYCEGSRDLRFVGPFRDMEQGKSAASRLRDDTLEEKATAGDYRVNFWMVRRYVQGADSNPRIQRPETKALGCA